MGNSALDFEKQFQRAVSNSTVLAEFWKPEHLTPSSKEGFLRYIQVVDSLLKSPEVKANKMHIPLDFIERIINQSQTDNSLAKLFVFYAYSQFPERFLAYGKGISEEIEKQFGCLEFNPFKRYDRSEPIRISSTTFPNSFPHHTASYLVGENLIDHEKIVRFQKRLDRVLRNNFFFDQHLRANKQQLYNLKVMLYELMSNVLIHGRLHHPTTHGNTSQSGANFWFFKLEIDKFANENEYNNFFNKRPHFIEYSEYLSKRTEHMRKAGKTLGGDSGNLKIVTISIYDNGEGIVDHYQNNTGNEMSNRQELFLSIVENNLSSTPYTGAGEGLGNAFDSVYRLSGAISIRTNEIWSVASAQNRKLQIINDSGSAPNHLAGTAYTILLPTTSSLNPL